MLTREHACGSHVRSPTPWQAAELDASHGGAALSLARFLEHAPTLAHSLEDADDDAPEQGAAPAAPLDLYAMLGYRPSFMSNATTQQWLAIRLIEL